MTLPTPINDITHTDQQHYPHWSTTLPTPINDTTYTDQWHYPHRSVTLPTPINDTTYTDQWHYLHRSVTLHTPVNDTSYTDQWHYLSMTLPTPINNTTYTELWHSLHRSMTLPINDTTYTDQWHYLHRSITIPTPINDITYTNQLHWSGKGFLTLGIYLLVFRLRRGLRFDSDTTRAQLCTPCSKLVAENVQPFGWKRKESQAFMLYLATHVGDGGGERERENSMAMSFYSDKTKRRDILDETSLSSFLHRPIAVSELLLPQDRISVFAFSFFRRNCSICMFVWLDKEDSSKIHASFCLAPLQRTVCFFFLSGFFFFFFLTFCLFWSSFRTSTVNFVSHFSSHTQEVLGSLLLRLL